MKERYFLYSFSYRCYWCLCSYFHYYRNGDDKSTRDGNEGIDKNIANGMVIMKMTTIMRIVFEMALALIIILINANSNDMYHS